MSSLGRFFSRGSFDEKRPSKPATTTSGEKEGQDQEIETKEGDDGKANDGDDDGGGDNGDDKDDDSTTPQHDMKTTNGPTNDEQNRNNNSDDNNNGPANSKEEQPSPPPSVVVRLTKSTRLKGYITFAVASAIHFNAAMESGKTAQGDFAFVEASNDGQAFAMVSSMLTGVISVLAILMHFDRFTCLRTVWQAAFKPNSTFELVLLLFLLVWWVVATAVNTSIRGIAGDGKGHYNLYFSTWICCWTSFWILERWLRAAGKSSFQSFAKSWPNRAPGWILIFILSLADFSAFLDLFMNWDEGTRNAPASRALLEGIRPAQWAGLIGVCALTFPIACGFSLVELFRVNRTDDGLVLDENHKASTAAPPRHHDNKSDRENLLEGFCLLLLVGFWIPTVTVATTPGGAASFVGNAYFFSWMCTVSVIETLVWWIRDWRQGIHEAIELQRAEYNRAKLAALRKQLLAEKGERFAAAAAAASRLP